jgi:TatD DNase family protein
LVRHLPLACLLLESDSPVLGPEPGERNEPANVPLAAEAVAEIKGVPPEAVLEAAYGNTLRLYGEPVFSP